ncbi:MAG: hypothetical protein GY941_21740 [Planctomycetes bacterium]|nr:hypothetical protein [Planctomycetota bacterium]
MRKCETCGTSYDYHLFDEVVEMKIVGDTLTIEGVLKDGRYASFWISSKDLRMSSSYVNDPKRVQEILDNRKQ